MDLRFTRFEIITGTGAVFLCLAFACVMTRAAVVENQIALATAQAVDREALFWLGVEPQGRRLVLTGTTADPLARDRAGAAATAVPGVAQVTNLISVLDDGATCQRLLHDSLGGETIAFKPGRPDPADASVPVLVRAAAVLRNCGLRFEVATHTAGGGDAAINLQLSQRRAEAAVRLLVESGVDPMRLAAVGYGSRQPVADNRTEAGRSANQRLEFRILGAES
jgi:OmpA-OmpF porin, OOP family